MKTEIPQIIHEAIRREIDSCIEEEIKNFNNRIEQRVRGQVGSIVTKVLERFSAERLGNELVIRVEIEKK